MPEESTTSDLVERVRGLVGDLDRHDPDTFASFHAPDAVFDAYRGRFEGVAATIGFVEAWVASYEDFAVALGNGVVFTVVSHKGRLLGAARYLHQLTGRIFVFVNDLGASVTFYPEAQIGAARGAAERLGKEQADG